MHAGRIAVMLALLLQVSLDRLGGGLPGRAGEVASAEKFLGILEMELLAQPFADAALGFADASRHGFGRQQTRQQLDVHFAGGRFQDMHVVILQQSAQCCTVELGQRG